MSLPSSHPGPVSAGPSRSCPQCSCDLHGDRLCEVCGTADLPGGPVWICFACGERNRYSADRCRGCGKHHVLVCPACDCEGYYRDRFCERCGAARALYPTIRRLLAEAARTTPVRPARGRAITVSVLLALVAFSAGLGLAGGKNEAAAATAAGALATAALLGRRAAASVPGRN